MAPSKFPEDEKAELKDNGAEPLTLDWSVLEDLSKLDTEGEPGIVKELSDLLISNMPERLGNIKNFIENKEYEKASKQAHAIKSSGGNLGAMRFSKLCEELEHFKQWDIPGEAMKLVDKIEKEFLAVRDGLVKFLNRSK